MFGDFAFLFAVLMMGHALGDFALQNDYVAREKKNSLIVMSMHCLIHAGIVLFLTASVPAAAFQYFSHFVIDKMKCEGSISFREDQALHTAVMLAIALCMSI